MWIILAIFCLISAVVAIADIWQNKTMTNNIIELIFIAIHLIVLGFFIMVTLNSFGRGSEIIRGLSYSAHEGVSIPLRIASAFIFFLGVGLLVYGILILAPLGIKDFNFPIALKWAIVNAGLLLIVLMGAFFLFPFLFAKNPTLTKKEETERIERRKQK